MTQYRTIPRDYDAVQYLSNGVDDPADRFSEEHPEWLEEAVGIGLIDFEYSEKHGIWFGHLNYPSCTFSFRPGDWLVHEEGGFGIDIVYAHRFPLQYEHHTVSRYSRDEVMDCVDLGVQSYVSTTVRLADEKIRELSDKLSRAESELSRLRDTISAKTLL